MSTVQANRYTDSSGGVLAPISSVMRNRIINGAMVIDQRNAGASVTPAASTFTLDRWAADMTQASKYSIEQTIAGVAAPVGFTDYLGVTSTSAYSVLTTDTFLIRQIIEGFNIADLGWGTANAATVTLSFWVRSSLTGTFGGALTSQGTSFRSYPYSYVISAANTWEYKTITIAGDTSGTWNTTNGTGINVRFGLGSGSTFSGTAGAWAAGNIVQPTGTASLVGTNNATFYITGVQLERGTQATSFEYRQYGQELALCQRYFINWVGNATGSVGYPMVGTGIIASATQTNFFIPTPVPLRATPTTSFSGTVNVNDATDSKPITSITNTYTSSSSGFWVILTASAGAFTLGRAAIAFVQNASTNSFSASSEL